MHFWSYGRGALLVGNVLWLFGQERLTLLPRVVVSLRAALHDRETRRLAIYYGGADTVTAIAFADLDEIVDFVKANSEV